MSLLLFLRIFHNKKVKTSVNKLKLFSKRVSAKIFPKVFNPKIKRKTHKMIFTTFVEINFETNLPFMSNTYLEKGLLK